MKNKILIIGTTVLFFLNPSVLALENEAKVACTDCISTQFSAEKQTYLEACQLMLFVPECRDIPKEEKIDCTKPEDVLGSNTHTHTQNVITGCGKGILYSIGSIFNFLKSTSIWIYENAKSSSISKKIGQQFDSIINYFSVEFEKELKLVKEYDRKNLNESEEGYQNARVVTALTVHLSSGLLEYVAKSIKETDAKFSCYNLKTKSTKVCEFLVYTGIPVGIFVKTKKAISHLKPSKKLSAAEKMIMIAKDVKLMRRVINDFYSKIGLKLTSAQLDFEVVRGLRLMGSVKAKKNPAVTKKTEAQQKAIIKRSLEVAKGEVKKTAKVKEALKVARKSLEVAKSIEARQKAEVAVKKLAEAKELAEAEEKKALIKSKETIEDIGVISPAAMVWALWVFSSLMGDGVVDTVSATDMNIDMDMGDDMDMDMGDDDDMDMGDDMDMDMGDDDDMDMGDDMDMDMGDDDDMDMGDDDDDDD